MASDSDPESNLNILITLLVLFTSLWYFIFTSILELQTQRLTSFDLDFDWKIGFLLTSSYLIMSYILMILYALFFGAAVQAIKYFKKEEVLKKKDELFEFAILGWPAILVLIFFLLFYLITYYSLNKQYGYFILIIVGYGTIIYNFLRKYIKKQHLKFNFKQFLKSGIFGTIIHGLLFFSYCMILVPITTDVLVKYEKDVFLPNESVRVELRPTGILLPKISTAMYSNKYIVIFNGTDEEFKSVPRYLTIDPKILTTEPENSFIAVSYTYFDTKFKRLEWLNRYGNIVISNVPVYKE